MEGWCEKRLDRDFIPHPDLRRAITDDYHVAGKPEKNM
jgi:hypothetical protein